MFCPVVLPALGATRNTAMPCMCSKLFATLPTKQCLLIRTGDQLAEKLSVRLWEWSSCYHLSCGWRMKRSLEKLVNYKIKKRMMLSNQYVGQECTWHTISHKHRNTRSYLIARGAQFQSPLFAIADSCKQSGSWQSLSEFDSWHWRWRVQNMQLRKMQNMKRGRCGTWPMRSCCPRRKSRHRLHLPSQKMQRSRTADVVNNSCFLWMACHVQITHQKHPKTMSMWQKCHVCPFHCTSATRSRC